MSLVTDRTIGFLKCNPPGSVVSVLLGGSRVYSVTSNSDWDGAIIVRDKKAMFDIVRCDKLTLMRLVGIVTEEYAFELPQEGSRLWDEIDCIRFAGKDETGTKRSIKLFHKQWFDLNKNCLNIYAHKDIRVYDSHHPQVVCYQQATKLDNGMHILHDQIAFASPSTICKHGMGPKFVSFGVVSDLLLSGVWVYGAEAGAEIEHRVLTQYITLAKKGPTSRSFCRQKRFSEEYRNWLDVKLEGLKSTLPSETCDCAEEIPASQSVFANVQFTYKPMPLTFLETEVGILSIHGSKYKFQVCAAASSKIDLELWTRYCYPGSGLVPNNAISQAALWKSPEIPDFKLMAYAELAKCEDALRAYSMSLTIKRGESSILTQHRQYAKCVKELLKSMEGNRAQGMQAVSALEKMMTLDSPWVVGHNSVNAMTTFISTTHKEDYGYDIYYQSSSIEWAPIALLLAGTIYSDIIETGQSQKNHPAVLSVMECKFKYLFEPLQTLFERNGLEFDECIAYLSLTLFVQLILRKNIKLNAAIGITECSNLTQLQHFLLELIR